MTNENQGAQQAPATTDTGTGSQPEATSLIESANLARERLERTLSATKAEADRLERVYAAIQFGGRSVAGQVPPKELTMEEKALEIANERLKRAGVRPLAK